MSYDCGASWVRDADALRASMSISAAHPPADAPREPFEWSPELSRRARGVELWAALRSLGRSGVAEPVERCCRHARRFAEVLEAAGQEVSNEERCPQIIERIQRAGVCRCGPTRWRGRPAVRISVSGWSTTEADVERSLESILEWAGSSSSRSSAA